MKLSDLSGSFLFLRAQYFLNFKGFLTLAIQFTNHDFRSAISKRIRINH